MRPVGEHREDEEADHGLTGETDRSDNTEAYCKSVANASAFTGHNIYIHA